MLPSLCSLNVDELKQANTAVKRDREGNLIEPTVALVKACSGQYRLLSNLFGTVEWEYQRSKFKPDCSVYRYLTDGMERAEAETWSPNPDGDFDVRRKQLGHGGQLKSYTTPGGDVASGLLAQFTSVIAKGELSALGKKRLKIIRELFPGTPEENAMSPEVWKSTYVNAPVSEEEGNRIMHECLRRKYAIPKYRDALLSTGTKTLHERPSRGKPSSWEYQELSEEQKQKLVAKGIEPYEGGDRLGKLMTRVRAELSAQEVVNVNQVEMNRDGERDDGERDDGNEHVEILNAPPQIYL